MLKFSSTNFFVCGVTKRAYHAIVILPFLNIVVHKHQKSKLSSFSSYLRMLLPCFLKLPWWRKKTQILQDSVTHS